MTKAWVGQDAKQIAKVGKRKASWYANWYEPSGKRRCKSFGSGSKGKQLAFRHCDKVERDIATGAYQTANQKMSWADFLQEFRSDKLAQKNAVNSRLMAASLKRFTAKVNPKTIAEVNTKMIDRFITARMKDRGQKKGSKVTASTVNKDLRALKHAFRVAAEWDLIVKPPVIHFLSEPEKIGSYVTPEHFAAMFDAASQMNFPRHAHAEPVDWWQCVLSTCFLTGWRINEVHMIHRSDLDFSTGVLSARYQNEKRSRDDRVRIPDELLELLRPIWTVDYPLEWTHGHRAIYEWFGKLQKLASIHLPCNDEHEHTDSCHRYGFHDLRRGFATANARSVAPNDLQKLMKHRSFVTTKKYIQFAETVQTEQISVYIPEALKK